MKENFLVSIITPSFNGGKYIEECIKSIKNQSYKHIEHIIIDGGSKDNTIELLKKYEGTYNMTWISEPDKGMYDAINKGFNMAKGEILAWLNTDDMYFPWAVETAVKTINKYNIDWLTGVPGMWNKEGYYYNIPFVIPVYYRSFIKRGFYHDKGLGFIQQESTFWTRQLWEKAGGKTEDQLLYAGDFFLWKTFSKYSDLYTINTVLGGFRKHGNQKTTNMDGYYKEIKDFIKVSWFLKILNKFLKIPYIKKLIFKSTLINSSDIFENDI